MNNITIIIKDDFIERIYKYTSFLSQLYENNNVQLCIVSNIITNLDISIDYTIFRYNERSDQLYSFYEAISMNDIILLIQDAMELNTSLVSEIKVILENNELCNYTLKIKKYVNDYEFFYDNELLIYNKSATEVILLDITLNNYFLIEAECNEFYRIINGFINKRFYDYFYKWYEFLLCKDNKKLISVFYKIFEETKITMSVNDVKEMERYFINNTNDKMYNRYLGIKSRLIDENYDQVKFENTYVSEFYDLSSYDYFAFIFYYFLKRNISIYSLFMAVGVDKLNSYLEYLSNLDSQMHEYFYDFISMHVFNNEIYNLEKNRLSLNLILIRKYIQLFSHQSLDKEKKEKLFSVLNKYIEHVSYLLENTNTNEGIISYVEKSCVLRIKEALQQINNDSLKEVVMKLEEASYMVDFLQLPVRYYIQKLINENNIFFYKMSFCLIVRNEEMHLERCLKSIKPFVECGLAEIIIVDTGSVDKTLEIAKKYTNNIYHYKWKDNFAEARNFSISMAKGEYLFVLDADEEIDPVSITDLRDLFTSEEHKIYSTFSFKEKNYLDEDLKSFGIFTRYFIFKNDGDFYYLGSIHEQPVIKHRIIDLNMNILHYGYILNEEIKEKKFKRNADLLKNELSNNPNNLYYRYQLCTTYMMHNDYRDALIQAEILLNKIKDIENIRDYLIMYSGIVLAYYSNNLYEKVIDICDKVLRKQEDYIDLVFYKAQALFALEKYVQALVYVKRYLSLLDEFSEHEIYNDIRILYYTLDAREKALNMALLCCYANEQYYDFIDYIFQIDENLTIMNSLMLIIDAYFKINDFEGLAYFYENIILDSKNSNLKPIFSYFLYKQLTNLDSNSYNEIIIKLRQYIQCNLNLVDMIQKSEIQNKYLLLLNFLNTYDINKADIFTAKLLIYDIIELIENHSLNMESSEYEFKNYLKCIRFVLIRTMTIRQFGGLSDEKLLDFVNKYLNVSIFLFNNKYQYLNMNEREFISCFIEAFDLLEKGDLVGTLRLIKNGVEKDKEMARPMELFISKVLNMK